MVTDEKVYSLVKVPVCDNCGHRFEDLEYREWADNEFGTRKYKFVPGFCPECGKSINGTELDIFKKIVRVHVLM